MIKDKKLNQTRQVLPIDYLMAESKIAASIFDLTILYGMYRYYANDEYLTKFHFEIFADCYKKITSNSLKFFNQLFVQSYKAEDDTAFIDSAIERVVEFAFQISIPMLDVMRGMESKKEFKNFMMYFQWMESIDVLSEKIFAFHNTGKYLNKIKRCYDEEIKLNKINSLVVLLEDSILQEISVQKMQDDMKKIAYHYCKTGKTLKKSDIEQLLGGIL